MPTSDRRSTSRRSEDKVSAWERWQLASLDSPAAPVQVKNQRLENEVKLPTAADVAQIENQARTAGYAAGQAQARDEARRFSVLVAGLEGAVSTFDQSVAEDVLSLALEVARQVVRQAVEVKPELLLDVIREALGQMPHGHAMVQLHPADAALVRQYLGEQLAHASHRIHEDPSVARGGCVIEANGSQLDASLATRWKRIVESTGAKNEWVEAGQQPKGSDRS